MITVRDILRESLPAETALIAGEAALGREVTWATRPRPSPPAFAHLSGGELVLLSATALTGLDERMTLEAAVTQLAAFGVAAIAVDSRVPAAARHAADAAGMVVLQLPDGSELGVLEREIAHHILERRRELQRRGQDAGRRLMELAIAGEPLVAIIEALAGLAERPVVLEGRDGRLLLYHEAPSGPDRDAIEGALAESRRRVSEWLRQTVASSPAEPPATVAPLDRRWSRVMAPIIGRDGLLGSLSLILPADMAQGDHEALASRGAAACAVVMAREHATQAARREIELSVLDEVLDGALRSEVTLMQQAKRLGHDLAAPHVMIVARIDHVGTGGPVRARDTRWSVFDEAVGRRAPRLLWRVRNNAAELLWPVANDAEAAATGAQLRDDVQAQLAGLGEVVSIGIGRVRGGLAGIQQSHQEAKQALTIGRRLHGNGRMTRFDELGVYRLIFAAEQLPELMEFRDEALGTLIAYDEQHHADLVPTLKAFFDAKCGPKEAAALLDVHRNTVLYRLDRIRDITGLDLDNADVRLRLHLALCVHLAFGGRT